MASPLSRYDAPSQLAQLRDQGWCAFEEAYDRTEVDQMRGLLHGHIDGLDPARLAGFGATIFALAAREPRMGRLMEQACVMPFMRLAMEGPFDVRRTGARISGSTSHDRIVWHHHHGWVQQDLAQRKTFERLHFICYLNGTDRAAGPLIVKPRAFSDAYEGSPNDLFQPLEDEQTLEFPPGTIIALDAPVLHSAWRGSGDDLRTIWGVHVQKRGDDRPHPDDDAPLEKARVRVRHQAFRWGVRNAKRWLDAANRSPLPTTGGY